MRIILASGSPRRRQLLMQAGIPYEIIVSDEDETATGLPDAQVRELALRKANAALALLSAGATPRPGSGKPASKTCNEAIIVAADTLVSINNEILGKPDGPSQAFQMLRALQGSTHRVYTGVALIKAHNNESIVFSDMAEVTFRPLSDNDIYAYIATGEPFDKAGAYGIQGRGSVLVDRINGDFYTVMGLPISKVCTALEKMGYDYWNRG